MVAYWTAFGRGETPSLIVLKHTHALLNNTPCVNTYNFEGKMAERFKESSQQGAKEKAGV